jgi:hypothetical protein
MAESPAGVLHLDLVATGIHDLPVASAGETRPHLLLVEGRTDRDLGKCELLDGLALVADDAGAQQQPDATSAQK